MTLQILNHFLQTDPIEITILHVYLLSPQPTALVDKLVLPYAGVTLSSKVSYLVGLHILLYVLSQGTFVHVMSIMMVMALSEMSMHAHVSCMWGSHLIMYTTICLLVTWLFGSNKWCKLNNHVISTQKCIDYIEKMVIFSSPVQSTGRAIVLTLASAFALALALAFPSRHF